MHPYMFLSPGLQPPSSLTNVDLTMHSCSARDLIHTTLLLQESGGSGSFTLVSIEQRVGPDLRTTFRCFYLLQVLLIFL